MKVFEMQKNKDISWYPSYVRVQPTEIDKSKIKSSIIKTLERMMDESYGNVNKEWKQV